MKGKVKIAKINMTENEELEEQLQIENYPSIRFYKVGTKNIKDHALFQGTYKKFSIKEWVTLKLSEKIDKADIPDLTRDNYNNICKKGKGTCVIIFLDGDNAEVEGEL